MVFAFPSAFWVVGIIAAVAIVTWLRPGRRLVDVASVALWREALGELESDQRPKRRMPLSWLLLLLGCIAAAAALARPVWQGRQPRRVIAIQIVAGAELANDPGPARIGEAISTLCRRLDENDRVQVLLPLRGGGATKPSSPSDAIRASGHDDGRQGRTTSPS